MIGFDSPEKVILAYNGLGTWGQKSGTASFHGCPVSRCSLTDDRYKATDADAILYKDHFIHPGVQRPMNQIWILYFLECPYHTQSIKFADAINWTATYRRDSDLVAPYERWTYYDPQVHINSYIILVGPTNQNIFIDFNLKITKINILCVARNLM